MTLVDLISEESDRRFRQIQTDRADRQRGRERHLSGLFWFTWIYPQT